jgi:hypothetical protein
LSLNPIEPGDRRDIILEEWKECRASIREFDRTVTHLRSYTVLVTIALMAIGAFLASPRGLVVEALALAFLFAEYYLATHYRGYLHAVVKRAIALEKLLKPVISPKIVLEGHGTTGMLSEVIAVQRENAYGFLVAEAHNLLYLLLYAVDSALIIFTLSPLGGSALNPIWPGGFGTLFAIAGLYLLVNIRIRWNNRTKREVV